MTAKFMCIVGLSICARALILMLMIAGMIMLISCFLGLTMFISGFYAFFGLFLCMSIIVFVGFSTL